MPRAAWLAVGGLVSAVVLGVAAPPRPAILLGLAAAATVLAALCLVVHAERRPMLAALAAGCLLVVVRGALTLAVVPVQVPTVAPAGTRDWTASVQTISAPAAGQQHAVVLAEPRDAPAAAAGSRAAGGNAAGPFLLWVELPRYPSIAPGDRIAFRGAVESLPDDDDFGAYLRGLGAAGTVRGSNLALQPATSGQGAWLERLRRTVDGWIAAVLPEPQAGLSTAIVIGLRDRVDRGVAAAFTSAGLSHVVAISGWNICLVAATIGALLRRLPRRWRAVATVASVAVYTLLAGASPSVVRAALMAGTALLARESGRPGRASATLGLACLGMLLVDPGVVTDAGFQLSVAATAGLIAWGSGLHTWLRDHLPAAVPDSLTEALGISLAAQAATLPIVILQFGRLSLVSPAANLVAAPIVAPVMLAGVLAAAAGAALSVGCPAVLIVPVTVLGSLLVGALIAVATAAATLPFASFTLPPPWPPLGAAVTALLLLAGVHAGTRARLRHLARWLSGLRGRRPARPGRASARRRPHVGRATLLAGLVAVLAVAPLALGLSARPDGRFHMTVLDVGQGDAILLVGRRGTRMLVDTGPDPDRLLRLLDARIPAWDRHLSLLLVTHPHEDHVGGAALLLSRYRVDAVAEPGMRGAGPGYAAFAAEVDALHVPHRTLAREDRIDLDGATMLVRWPIPGTVAAQAPDDGRVVNDVSIVLDIQVGVRRLLLTGDAEDDVDPQLLADGLGDRPVDVLKVAHHGSRTATSAALLAAIRPAVAVISVGAHNLYGHPAPETLARLQAIGARTYRTDRDGSIEISTDGRDLRVQAEHAAALTFAAPPAVAAPPAIAAPPSLAAGPP